ncbi:hypothetical protein [Sphingobacterium kitahiroshimense]|uniref:Zinc-finger domain-containing protein n=1 Tax=Sphingobacterium kitahiroshimense TaxID=470446 RepID=A0ABV0BPW4_9SPHI
MAHFSTVNPMVSCSKASELLDKRSVLKLSLRENIALKLHLAICDACKLYSEQSKLLDKILALHLKRSDPDGVPLHVNSELKRRISTEIKKK